MAGVSRHQRSVGAFAAVCMPSGSTTALWSMRSWTSVSGSARSWSPARPCVASSMIGGSCWPWLASSSCRCYARHVVSGAACCPSRSWTGPWIAQHLTVREGTTARLPCDAMPCRMMLSRSCRAEHAVLADTTCWWRGAVSAYTVSAKATAPSPTDVSVCIRISSGMKPPSCAPCRRPSGWMTRTKPR